MPTTRSPDNASPASLATRPSQVPLPEPFRDRVRAALQSLRPRNTLLLSQAPAAWGVLLQHPGVVVPDLVQTDWLAGAMEPGADIRPRLYCRPQELPFRSGEFGLVVVHGLRHELAVRSSGEQDEVDLDEVQRVLEAGGSLVWLGSGHWCPGRRPKALARVSPGSLCGRLQARGFRVEECQGLGPAGTNLNASWQRPLLRFCPGILVLARYQPGQANLLHLGARSPGTRRSRPLSVAPALDGLSRKAGY